MSKIKQSLPEDFSVLQGDELDGTPPISDEPDALDFAMRDLSSAITTIEENKMGCFHYKEELKELSVKLANIAEFADVPF
jgi:hypothetical protein